MLPNGRGRVRGPGAAAVAALVVALAAATLAGCGQAQKDGAALSRIKARGKLVAGVKYDAPPFGYLDPKDNKVKGFDVEVAKEIAKKIFKDPEKIEFKQVTSQTRIPALQNGDVDIVIATMTINEERRKIIDFSDPYYHAGLTLMVPMDSPVQGVKDLDGRIVAAVQGANSGPLIEGKAKEQGAKITLQYYQTYPECLAAVQEKRADALATDNVIIMGLIDKDPRMKMVGGLLTDEPYGVGIAKGNEDLLELVNRVVAEINNSGRYLEIHRQWLGEPPK